jgi:translation initiation factor eIF-2B subunit alpha/methylthioribose-1-phosphate isomerase
MMVNTNEGPKEMRSVWMEDAEIKFIDQRLLPQNLEIFTAKNLEDTVFAIKDMVVRGAPAIGAAAAYGIAQAQMLNQDLKDAAEKLRATRPTAQDLFTAVDFMMTKLNEGSDAKESAEEYVESILDKCRKIGEHGEKLIKNDQKILTHCNAGALATVDLGTALAPIRLAFRNGKKIFVYVDETRPRLQGARLTAWELENEGIPYALIADNAAGHFMKRGEIDLVIVGADRIVKNGDFANKIGTYEKAVLACENKIPFYVAAPITTFDFSIDDGNRAKNPAFDVTPVKYVTGYITESGIIEPKEISSLESN